MPAPLPSEIAAACFAAFARRDPDAFVALVHEDVVWRPASTLYASDPAQQQPYRGHAGVRAWFEHVAGWTGYEVRTLEAEDAGSRAFVSAVATLAGEAQWLLRAVFFVFEVEGGRVRDLRTFADESEARTHAGLPQARVRLAAGAERRASVTLPCDPARLAPVRGRLRAAGTEAGMGAAPLYDLLVATTEAVTNAMTHGAPGPVEVEWGVEHDLFVVCVSDRGGGRAPTGLTGDREHHGRGIAVMRLLVDGLALASGAQGTTVRISKRIAPSLEAHGEPGTTGPALPRRPLPA